MRLIALCRGINLAGRNRISMADLRRVMETLGHTNVRTHIQSGNLIFDTAESDRDQLASVICDAIAKAHGLSVPVVIRSADEMARALAAHPFRADEPDGSRLAVSFMPQAPSEQATARLDTERFLPDRFQVAAADIFLHFPNGQAKTTMTPNYFDRRLGIRGTIRNVNTIEQIILLAAQG